MRFRPQRGGYEESMAETVHLDATYDDLAHHLDVDINRLSIEFYCHDTRNLWDTYVVNVDGEAVGFTDGPLRMCVCRRAPRLRFPKMLLDALLSPGGSHD